MSLLFTDGFDAYTTGSNIDLSCRWNAINELQGFDITGISPHNLGASLYADSVSGDLNKIHLVFRHHATIPDNLRSGIVGFHFRTDDITQYVVEPILGIMHIDVLNYQSAIRIAADGELQVYDGNTILVGSGGTINNDTWHHIEVKYMISGSIPANSYQVRLDGAEVINLPGGTNVEGAFDDDGIVGALEVQGADGANRYWDNFYILSLTGVANTGFIGPCFIETIYPTGDGSQKEFTGSDGDQIDNYLLVDDTFPDDDTTYVESSTSGDIDVYKFANPVGNVGTIRGINLVNRARKTTTAIGASRNVAKVSGTNYFQNQFPLSRTYDYNDTTLDVNPDTNGPWTVVHFDENEFGMQFQN